MSCPHHRRFKILTTSVRNTVFCDLIRCGLVESYQHFRGDHHFRLWIRKYYAQEGNSYLQSICLYLQCYTAQCSRKA
jgi:hypothetical protein